jgi:thiamine biosynthesis lipoprotein
MNPENQNLLIHVSRRAMACQFEVCFPAGRCPEGTRFALESLRLVESVEEQLSFFRPESLVSRINRLAAEGAVPLEPWLFELLELASRLYEETGGAYDITSAPLWEAWGFARRAGEIPSEAELAEARSRVGGHLLELDAARQTVRFLRPGVRISMGSIGKGHALDLCAQRLLALGMSDFLLHAGQSSVLGRGSSNPKSQIPNQQIPWEIGLGDPRRIGRRLAVVRLRDRALGTSSAQFQSFRRGGRRYGHVLDPRSGRPAEGVLSTTVVAATAAAADALSTAFHVMGPEPSLAYCQSRPEIGLVMVCPGRQGGDVETFTAGFEPGELTMCRD